MESLDFWKSLIQGEKNAIPDRSGKTAFTDMIDKLSILPPGNQTKKSSEFFLGELSRYFGEFTLMDIRNLMLFLESIIFSDSVEIARKYWKDFEKLGNHTEEEIEKRGLVLRFITANSNFPFSKDRIIRERDLRNQKPWLWIECMANRSWDTCINEVIKVLKEEYDYEELRLHFSIWIESDNGKSKLSNAFEEWYDVLEDEDKVDLQHWANNHDIHLNKILKLKG